MDGSIRRIDTAWDSQGNPYLVTSYSATSGGSIVNQVQRAFDGLGQVTTEWQAVGGAVNTSTTPRVQYAYTEMAGGVNNDRPMTPYCIRHKYDFANMRVSRGESAAMWPPC